MNTWKNQKRQERRDRQAKEMEAREIEQRRLQRRTTWERIEEANISEDVKELLHAMAEHMGMK